MRHIEIDSDKTTVGLVVFFLLAMLVGIFSNFHALTNHPMQRFELHFWDYLIAAFNVYAAVVVIGDSKLRKDYPYGAGGVFLIALVLLMRIAAHWAGRSPAIQDLLGTSLIVVSIGYFLLFLTEGALWLRRKVTLI